MMYKCDDCGTEFDEDEIAKWEESRGEFWGAPCYEKMAGCPSCYSTSISEMTDEDEENEGEKDDG